MYVLLEIVIANRYTPFQRKVERAAGGAIVTQIAFKQKFASADETSRKNSEKQESENQ